MAEPPVQCGERANNVSNNTPTERISCRDLRGSSAVTKTERFSGPKRRSRERKAPVPKKEAFPSVKAHSLSSNLAPPYRVVPVPWSHTSTPALFLDMVLTSCDLGCFYFYRLQAQEFRSSFDLERSHIIEPDPGPGRNVRWWL